MPLEASNAASNGIIVAIRILVMILGLAALAAPVQAGEPRVSPWEELTPDELTPETTSETVPYQVEFLGTEDSALLSTLEAASQLIELENRPPPTPARLNFRIEEDLARFNAVLHSESYYDATLRSEIDTDETPAKVVIHIETGRRYRLSSYEIVYEGLTPPPEKLRPDMERLGLEPRMPARGPRIAAAGQLWVVLMTQRGYPFARVVDRKSVINRDTKTMSVVLRVDAGAPARFGPVTISGLEQLDPVYVRRLLTWEQGETYDSRKIEEVRRRLSQTRIFASIGIQPDTELDDQDELPITINLAEGPPRTIGFGVNYSTDVGPGGSVFWEHRNIFGQGESLRFTITGSEIEQSLEASVRKPTYPGRKQALIFNVELSNEETDAFDARTASALAAIESRYLEDWLMTAGLAPEFSDVEEMGDKEKFLLLGLPITGTQDRRNDRLNPTRGTRLNLTLTPYLGLGDDNPDWITGTAEGSGYLAVDEDRRFVLANRAKVGFLFGADNEDLPASKRFYAGGGGSIRGYEFQSVGDLDRFNDPIGGRSVIEVSSEFRMRVTEQIGVVPFVDGGTVYQEAYPDFSNTFRWAAGLGLRYFTGFGPVRLDVAFPIHKRDSDDTYQFYISFGQAF
jgi:translocation and assembly module TamA